MNDLDTGIRDALAAEASRARVDTDAAWDRFQRPRSRRPVVMAAVGVAAALVVAVAGIATFGDGEERGGVDVVGDRATTTASAPVTTDETMAPSTIADDDEDGAFDESSTSAATTATTVDGAAPTTVLGTAPAETTTSTAPTPQLMLRGDGIGAAAFGAPMDDVVAVVSAPLGPPREDQTFPASNSCTSATRDCLATQGPVCSAAVTVRDVAWDGLTLIAYGSDETDQTFHGWQATGPATVPTADGVSIGDAIDRWREVYGDRFNAEFFQGGAAEGDPWIEVVVVDLPGGPATGFTGLGNPPTHLSVLGAGPSCGDIDY
jgi:hypothetical protein